MNNLPIPKEESISGLIYIIRGEKVMLDFDLAELYGVETRRLKEQVRRNISRFPEDFMFEITDEETRILRSQIATSSWGGLEKKDIELDEKVTLIFVYLKELEQTKHEETDFKQRKRIGFKT